MDSIDAKIRGAGRPDCADAAGGQHGNHRFRTIWQEGRHPVPHSHAMGSQSACAAEYFFRKLRVSQGSAPAALIKKTKGLSPFITETQ